MHLSTAGLAFDGGAAAGRRDGRARSVVAAPSLVARLSADAVTRTLLNGFYVVKTRLQVRHPHYHFCHAFVEAQNLWREGLAGFLRGGVVGWLRVVPYSAVQWATARAMGHLLAGRVAEEKACWVANGLATAAAVAVTYPLNTVQTRLALLPLRKASYSTVIDDLTKGGSLLTGLYSGVLAIVPGQLAYYIGQVIADKLFLAVNGPVDEHKQPTKAFIQSCLRATLANLLAYPFDTLCVRMQAGVLSEKGILHCAKSTYEEQGIGGFYQGVGVTLLKVLPFALFLYFTFQLSNQWFEKHGREERFASLHTALHTYWNTISAQIEAGSVQWQNHARRQFQERP